MPYSLWRFPEVPLCCSCMKVLVTGGTGFVGVGVAQALCARGHALTILARHPNTDVATSLASSCGARVEKGDVSSLETLQGALRGFEAVIHLVGIISEFGAATFENVHVRGTENMLRAAKEQGVSRFIHMSALGTRRNAVSRYHQTKWMAEQAVRNSGLSWTIFRPSLIYGPDDAFVNLFARISRFSPVVPVLGNPHALFQPVSVGVVSTAFSDALQQPDGVSQVFDLCGPERLTMEGILSTIFAVLGRKRFVIQIPQGLARLQAHLLEFVYPRLLKKASPLNRDQLIMLQEGNTGDGSPADRLFRLEHPTFREGISYLRGRPRKP